MSLIIFAHTLSLYCGFCYKTVNTETFQSYTSDVFLALIGLVFM